MLKLSASSHVAKERTASTWPLARSTRTPNGFPGSLDRNGIALGANGSAKPRAARLFLMQNV